MSFTLHSPFAHSRTRSRSVVQRIGEFAGAARNTLHVWRARHNERSTFPVLNDRDLRDLRLSRWDVEQELSKPFWRA